MAFGGDEGEAEGDLQGQFLLGAFKSIRQGFEHLQPFAEVADRFRMCRALIGTLASPLPVGHGGHCQTCLGVVMRYQLGLRLDGVAKLRL